MLGSLHTVTIKQTELYEERSISDKFSFSTVTAYNPEELLIHQAEMVSTESLSLGSIIVLQRLGVSKSQHQ